MVFTRTVIPPGLHPSLLVDMLCFSLEGPLPGHRENSTSLQTLAEYSCASATCKELTFVRNLLSELHVQIPGPITLAVDNSAAIKIAKERGVTKLTKHFDFAAHRIRSEYEHLRVLPTWVDTFDQTADLFTKALEEHAFTRHRDKLLQR